MSIKKHIALIIFITGLLLVMVFAGEEKEKQVYLNYPEGYSDYFTHYHTMNRAGEQRLAKMYANDKALVTMKKNGRTGYGSVIVMEVYKPVMDDEGNPVTGDKGIYEPDTLAAVAVMEKRASWHESFPEDELLGNWGFTIFTPNRTPTHKSAMQNNRDCVACHVPLKESNDSLFTYERLAEAAENAVGD